MRIFVSGNEELARLHMPIAQAKVMEFASRCEKAGLKQNSYTFLFEDTGVSVHAQYAFGQLAMQMHAPFTYEAEEESSEVIVKEGPKTFWINTTQGYFWVEVRYAEDGVPVVTLTPFTATVISEDGMTEEFIYPGMGMQAAGMIAGCIGDVPNQRYVLTQSGGVMAGEDDEKGTIKLPGMGDGNARITVTQNDSSRGFFCVLENDSGKTAQVKVISIQSLADELVVDMKHGAIDMLVEAELGNINPENFPKMPTYVHRKCTGSYMSPNKTIGYHVDIGSDDEYHGNTFAIPPGAQNKLDNGADGEFYFNHTEDLYGIASLFGTPISFSESEIELVLVTPTLVWEVRTGDDLCWGGFGESQMNAACIDIQSDSIRNTLAPRLCRVKLNFSSQSITAEDLGFSSTEIDVASWCGDFGASLFSLVNIECGPKFYYEKTEEDNIVDPCSWTEDGTGICDFLTGTSYSIEYPREQNYIQHWVKNFKENIANERKVEFRFGRMSYLSSPEDRSVNPYFLFDGLWHLDFGVMHLSSPSTSNTCGLCANPPFSQVPGELVYFMFNGTGDVEWILQHGHEYAHNLEIVTPLGIHTMPNNSEDGFGEYLGFIAKVPESLAAPHEPEVLTGGVTYLSENIEGESVKCEYSLMSAPCACDTPPAWGAYSEDIALNETVNMYFTGGCPPFSWTGSNVSFVYADGTEIDSETLKKTRNLYVQSNDECSGSVRVYEVCGDSLERSKSLSGEMGTVTGPSYLQPEETGVFYHDMGASAVYTGTLEMVSESEGTAILRMPAGASGTYTASWEVTCGGTGSMPVITDPDCTWGVAYGVGEFPGAGAYFYVYNVPDRRAYVIGEATWPSFGVTTSTGSLEIGHWGFMNVTLQPPYNGSWVAHLVAKTSGWYYYSLHSYVQVCP